MNGVPVGEKLLAVVRCANPAELLGAKLNMATSRRNRQELAEFVRAELRSLADGLGYTATANAVKGRSWA